MDELEIVRQLQMVSTEFRHFGFSHQLSPLLDIASEIILQKQECTKVVRCVECKHWKHFDHVGCTDFVKVCGLANYMIGANGYCLYGERKDKDNDITESNQTAWSRVRKSEAERFCKKPDCMGIVPSLEDG